MLENIIFGALFLFAMSFIALLPFFVVGVAIYEAHRRGLNYNDDGRGILAVIICSFFCVLEIAIFLDWVFGLGKSVLG